MYRSDPRWHHFDQIDSTQAELKRRLDADAHVDEWTVIQADVQNHSIGRHGRQWTTLPGALAISVLLRPRLAVQSLAWIGPVAGLAMVDALDEFRVQARLKWPNDLMIRDRKIGGLIAHAHYTEKAEPVILLGLGLNLRGASAEFAARGLPQASSIEAEVQIPVWSATDIAEQWLAWLNKHLESLELKGPSALLDQYRTVLADTGKQAIVRTVDDRQIYGRLTGVNPRGELEVETSDGYTETVLAGIVEWQP